jgi:hypothetical protein
MEVSGSVSVRQYGLNLFLVGFLVLFLELACIRWFSVYVVFLQFFTNFPLIACFLGCPSGAWQHAEIRTGSGGFHILH